MAERIIETGDKVHIITRRLFPDDLRRHFVGEVSGASGDTCQVHGYAFVFDSGANEFRKRPERRTRLYSLADASHIVNVLPRDVEIDSLEYRTIDKRLVVTDMKGFALDINEFGSSA